MTNPWEGLKCQGEGDCDLGKHHWLFAQILKPRSQVPPSLLIKISLEKVNECLELRADYYCWYNKKHHEQPGMPLLISPIH